MKWIQVPALTGCFALALGASVMGAQTAPPGGTPSQTTPNTPTAPGTGQDPATTGSGGVTSGSSGGQMASQTGTSDSGGSDKKFVKEAMQGSMAEIQLGQLAQQKASSDEVKQFGQKMVDDHTKLSDQMKPVASQMGLTPPTDLDSKHKGIQKKLEGLSGADFDKAYMKAMVKDHKKDLSEFQKEASSGKNPQVKDAAQQGAQVIQQHLQMAQDIAQKVGAKSGDKMGNSSNGAGTTGASSNTPGGTTTTSPSGTTSTTAPGSSPTSPQ